MPHAHPRRYFGAKRNACVAVAVDGQIRAACEQERLTRVGAVGLQPGRMPAEAVNQVLALAGRSQHQVTGYVVAEPNVQLPGIVQTPSVDHHQTHAATSFMNTKGWNRRPATAFSSIRRSTFREPIVCSPRDAVRVFYGTGLDMLVLGRFVLRK